MTFAVAITVLYLVVLPLFFFGAFLYRPKKTGSLIHLVRALAALALILFSLAGHDLITAGFWTLGLLIVAIRAVRDQEKI